MRGQRNKRKSGKRRFSFFLGKLSVHPMFLLFGVWHSIMGDLPLFLTIVVCAVMHELAHAVAAAKIGYGVRKIVLMPYGATLSVDLEGAAPRDELRIAVAGPICNLTVAAAFLALWWCFPACYPYTEAAFSASLSLALCNLLPALPLDGGKALYCGLLCLFNATLPPEKSKKRALWICQLLSVLLCVCGAASFLLGLVGGVYNISLAAFTVFLIFGLFPKQKSAYFKMDFSNRNAFRRGVTVKHVAVLADCTVKKALTFLCAGSYLVLEVYGENDKFVGTIHQGELSDFFQKTHLYATLGEYFQVFS